MVHVSTYFFELYRPIAWSLYTNYHTNKEKCERHLLAGNKLSKNNTQHVQINWKSIEAKPSSTDIYWVSSNLHYKSVNIKHHVAFLLKTVDGSNLSNLKFSSESRSIKIINCQLNGIKNYVVKFYENWRSQLRGKNCPKHRNTHNYYKC